MTPEHICKYYDYYPGTIVSRTLFLQRVTRARNRGVLDETVIQDALTLCTAQYKTKYGTRQTYCCINGETVNLAAAFKAIQHPTVNYNLFRSHLKSYSEKQIRQNLEDVKDVYAIAANYSKSDWMAFIGSGRSRRFVYRGKLYPQHHNQTFPSISHFLKIVGESDKLRLVQGRLKQGWGLDAAIAQDKAMPKDGNGRIYIITSTKITLVYVGSTTSTLKKRFAEHISEAKRGGSRKLCQAIRELGADNFEIELLELVKNVWVASQFNLLRMRERHNIKLFNSRHPFGLNDTAGGELTVRPGIKTYYAGQTYPSISAAARAVEDATSGAVPSYSAEQRFRSGEKIPVKTRKHSKHPDAGSNLYRRYLGLQKRDQLVPDWQDYDVFKRDVLKDKNLDEIISNNLILWRTAPNLKFGPENFRWNTKHTAIELRCGKVHFVFGKPFPSMEAISRHYNIPASTLRYWLKKHKISAEEAVRLALMKRNPIAVLDPT
jgi:hypothetical protein